MTTMSGIEWEACSLEPHPDAQLTRLARKRLGFVPGVVAYYADVPWAARAAIDLAAATHTVVAIDHRLADLIALIVSQDNSCRYCYAAQRVLLRIMGFPASRIRALEEDFLTADLAARETRALEFARRISRSNPLPTGADRQALHDTGFGDLAVKEIAAHAALFVYFNRNSTLPALPLDEVEQFEGSWRVRLLRPLIAQRFRRLRRRGAVHPLPASKRRGPFSGFVLALDGIPAAAALRDTLDAAWESRTLPARTKALIFAVIARGLGCSVSEQESIRLLGEAGMDRGEVEPVLAHLSSPGLTPVERVAVPFARETVRYQPAHIQRRAHEVREAMTNAEFIELVAVAGLANAICRLGVVLDRH